MATSLIDEAKQFIETIYEKYENNPHMLAKTHSYIMTQFPAMLENIRQTHEHRVQRMETMTQDQDTFIESFLNNNQYFYVAQTELFFYYNGLHYQTISEDDILYNILSSITKDRNLMSWKQKTKINIMKRIKENNNLFKSIPESETIQFVLDSLYPAVFASKNEAKYFLTILGDNILKKNVNLIHYIPTKAKPFLRELNNICQNLFGINLSNTFKHKFHDHEYSDCRIIKINDSIKSDTVWNPIVRNSTLDIACVACHYSVRYSSSDNYVTSSSNDDVLSKNTFYLRDNSSEDLVNLFIQEFIEIQFDKSTNKPVFPTGSPSSYGESFIHRATQITWKNMQYLWKQFLESKNLPPIMFLQTLKTTLVDSLGSVYNPDLDSFVGICCKHLPAIQKFIYFWNETVITDETESDFEIEELMKLFRRWCVSRKESPSTLNDKQILDIIIYFYPTIEIDRDKYITGIRCELWDKQLDIQVALDNLKEIYKNAGYNKNVSIYDAYIHYCKYYSNMNVSDTDSEKKLIVSKSYFEKYVLEYLANYAVDSKFLLADWYSN